jgi:anti-sigma regulatory factor (Ser/Thr protein kinase)
MITILEYCGVLLPAVFICSLIARMTGANTLNFMMCGLVAGELITVAVTVLTVKLRNRDKGIMLLPEREEEVLDFSVAPRLEEVSLIPHEIIGFCEDKVEKKRANQMAVAAEEMAVNTIKYGGSSLKSIDVMLSVSDEELVLRQRDDGIPFDPTDYTYDSEQYEYSGIEAIRALTDKITYLRILDLNNTTLEISRKK